MTCRVAGQIPGITFDGGHADYVVAPAVALARIPDGLSATDAGPLMCAGITTFNSLRNAGARSGDLVAVLGIGGLGHLGVQFAARMGYETVAIARGKDKEPLARKLGAHHYVDSEAQDPAKELAALAEDSAEEARHGEDDVTMRDRLEHLLLQPTRRATDRRVR